MTDSATQPAPTTGTARIGELDVLRGFALFGVFAVHFISSLFFLYQVDEVLAEAWKSSPLQYGVIVVGDLMFYDKANTLFTVLFGVGFWLQIEKLRARGEEFEPIYVRRLLILLVMGLLNKLLLFPGEVLFEYALLGLVLYACRGLSQRTMMLLGLGVSLVLTHVVYGFFEMPWFDGDAHDASLEAALLSESYPEWIAGLAVWHWRELVISLGIVPWGLYILGRFFLGAWIARADLIGRARAHRERLGWWAVGAILLGYGFEGVSLAVWDDVIELPYFFDFFFHAVAVPLIAAGYALGLIILCGKARWNWFTGLFRPVGQMALTAYVAHGALILIFVHPFGIYIRPMLSPVVAALVTVGLFLVMSVLCRLWLSAFRFGPLEWVWRSLTYGKAQPMLRDA